MCTTLKLDIDSLQHWALSGGPRLAITPAHTPMFDGRSVSWSMWDRKLRSGLEDAIDSVRKGVDAPSEAPRWASCPPPPSNLHKVFAQLEKGYPAAWCDLVTGVHWAYTHALGPTLPELLELFEEHLRCEPQLHHMDEHHNRDHVVHQLAVAYEMDSMICQSATMEDRKPHTATVRCLLTGGSGEGRLSRETTSLIHCLEHLTDHSAATVDLRQRTEAQAKENGKGDRDGIEAPAAILRSAAVIAGLLHDTDYPRYLIYQRGPRLGQLFGVESFEPVPVGREGLRSALHGSHLALLWGMLHRDDDHPADPWSKKGIQDVLVLESVLRAMGDFGIQGQGVAVALLQLAQRLRREDALSLHGEAALQLAATLCFFHHWGELLWKSVTTRCDSRSSYPKDALRVARSLTFDSAPLCTLFMLADELQRWGRPKFRPIGSQPCNTGIFIEWHGLEIVADLVGEKIEFCLKRDGQYKKDATLRKVLPDVERLLLVFAPVSLRVTGS